MTIAVGIDLSLTSTGIAIIYPGIATPPWVTRIESKGHKDATLDQRRNRLARLVHKISDTVIQDWPDFTSPPLVVIEGPSFGQARQGGQHDRAGLWWMTVDRFSVLEFPVVEVAPATRSKYATGKGNAAKDAVLAAVVRRYPNVEVNGNDEADALVLAAMGARHLGAPIDDLPKTHLAAMDAVRWPALTPGGAR